MDHRIDHPAASRRKRIDNALWGLFVGDSLAMPAHWIYGRENLRQTFDGGVRGFEAPPHPFRTFPYTLAVNCTKNKKQKGYR